MSSREFEEWKIFYGMDMHEPERSDYRSALLASQLMAALGVKEEHRRLDRLVLKVDTERTEQTEQEVEMKVRAAFAPFMALKGKKKGPGKS